MNTELLCPVSFHFAVSLNVGEKRYHKNEHNEKDFVAFGNKLCSVIRNINFSFLFPALHIKKKKNLLFGIEMKNKK